MVEGEPLDDHAPHGAAHDVRLVHAHGVEDGDGVIGHVDECVRRAPSQLRREPDVAVVEPHHVEALVAEELAPRHVVVQAL